MPRATVLLSGGMDSATTLALATEMGFECHALTARYGQRNAVEIDAAKRVARSLGAATHKVISVPLDTFGGSALTDAIPVPKDRPEGAIRSGGVPPTYVPARNTVLLSLALAHAETLGARDIFLGVNAVDFSGYPDCRSEFIEAFERLANLATKAGIEGERFRVRAPLIAMSKADIVCEGLRLGVDFGLTWSCYDPTAQGEACGRCDACRLRERAFEAAGFEDPLRSSASRSAESKAGARS
jgi:7-cyano-7-deazaguanine synthase